MGIEASNHYRDEGGSNILSCRKEASVRKTRSQGKKESQVGQRAKTDYMILWILRNDCELFFTPEKGVNLNHPKYFEQPPFSTQLQFEGYFL